MINNKDTEFRRLLQFLRHAQNHNYDTQNHGEIVYYRHMKERHNAVWADVPPRELCPQVTCATYYTLKYPFNPRFRVPGVAIMLAIKGGMKYSVAGRPERTARGGDIACFYSGVAQYMVLPDEPLDIYQMQFLPSNKPPFNSGVPFLPDAGRLPELVHVGNNIRIFVQLFERILQALLALKPTWQIEAASATLDIIKEIFAHIETSHASSEKSWDQWDRLVARIEDMQNIPKIRDMAKEASMSINQFIQEFAQRFGKSPKQYILERQLWKARQSMRKGKSVKDAAYEHGFHAPSYFSRLYKRKFGYPPTRTPAISNPALPDLDTSLPHNRLLFAPGVSSQLFAV